MICIFSEVRFEFSQLQWFNRTYSGSLPNNFESDLKVLINGEIWFRDRITLGELLIELKKWLKDYGVGVIHNFEYHSIDTENNPIFSIDVDFKSKSWYLRSTNQLFITNHQFNDNEIINIITNLIQEIKIYIYSNFGEINVSW